MGKHTTYYKRHKKGFFTCLHNVYILNKGSEHPSLLRDPQTQYKPYFSFLKNSEQLSPKWVFSNILLQSSALKSTKKMQAMK